MLIPDNLQLWLQCIKSDNEKMFEYLIANSSKEQLPEEDFIDLCLNVRSYRVLESWINIQKKKKEPRTLLTPYQRLAFTANNTLNRTVNQIQHLRYNVVHPLFEAMMASQNILEYILADKEYQKYFEVAITDQTPPQLVVDLLERTAYYVGSGRFSSSILSSETGLVWGLDGKIIDDMGKIPEVQESRKRWVQKKYSSHESGSYKITRSTWINKFERYLPNISYDGGYFSLLKNRVLTTDDYFAYLSWLFDPLFDWNGLWSIFGTSWEARRKAIYLDLEHYNIGEF